MTDQHTDWPPEPQTVRIFGRRRGGTDADWTPMWAWQLKGFSQFAQFEFKAEEVDGHAEEPPSDGAIYAAISQRDMAPDERRSLRELMDKAKELTEGMTFDPDEPIEGPVDLGGDQ